MSDAALPFSYIALVGAPNSGKTSLFNSLTGSRQKVGNYTGVTVEKKEGSLKAPSGNRVRILDLPGTYSLNATTLDEAVTRDVLLARHFEKQAPSLLVAVADATNLERNLNLVLELQELGIPMILALNMMDLAKRRGMKLNLEILSQELGIPVIPVVATKKKTTHALIETIDQHVQSLPQLPAPRTIASTKNLKEQLKARYQRVDEMIRRSQVEALKPAVWTERLDRLVLHPLWGSLCLVAVLTLIFQAIFNGASYPMEGIEWGIESLGTGLSALLPSGWFRSLLVDGILAGVGSVIIFLPQILFLFFIILFLEDSGYMARAAFLMDRPMRRVGLHGRSFIPLLSSFACAIPGIMATRTIENKRDRLTTILISPLMACSARLPVYTLLIAAFIPNQVLWGPIRMQGVVLLGLYLFGALMAFAMAWVFKKIFWRGEEPLFLLELPTYKWPSLRHVLHGMWERARLFLKRAGTIILLASMVVWFLSSYPKAPEDIPAGQSPILYSWAGQIGKAIEPAIQPLGFDWKIGVGLVTGVVAREVIVGTLGTLEAVESAEEGPGFQQLSQNLGQSWSLATGLSLLIFFVFAMQCLSTLAVVRRETNSWRWPAFMFVYMTALAYGAAYLTYHLTTWLTRSV